MATALFVCLHNAGRSQMSAALFERAAHGRHHALSAGSEADPDGRVHPQVVEVMRELGIDLSDRRPQRLTRRARRTGGRRRHDGLRRRLPLHPQASATLAGSSPTPKVLPVDEVRAIRDGIDRRVSELVEELDATAEAA